MADRSRMMNFHSSILQVASMIKNIEQKKSEESTEMEKKKRERKANYSREETEKLVTLITPKKDILENKKNGADQWQEKKQAWEDIERKFNLSSDGNYRDSKTLRIKYESMKRDVKKKWAMIQSGERNSIGKIPKLTAAEKKVRDILQLGIEDGFCDFSSINDKSDDDDDSVHSSPSDNTKDPDWSSVKQEVAASDDDEESLETMNNNLRIEFQSLNDEEPPNKRMRTDPLVPKPSYQSNSQVRDKSIIEGKLEVIRMKKELLKEELEVKQLQKRIMKEELEHKRAIHELEKQHLLLKIQSLQNGNTSV